MTLYLKYRPQTIGELDLTRVREQLQKIVNSKDMPHAFLFAGPKGTGKTSAARILAKAVNCEHPTKDGEPCNKCSQCLAITKGQSMDVVEMDAASNRGIDDIRSLRENVNLAPSSSRKKVYILDEAHMLTTEAANAFLKTLEEPPSHAMFILATTDPQKLPSTIHSRLTKVTFTKATQEEIAGQLAKVAKGEKLSIEPAAVSAIAKAADGSFRDAVKIIESLINSGTKKITEKQTSELLRHIEGDLVSKFIELLAEDKSSEALAEIENLIAQGVSISDFTDNLIETFRLELVNSVKQAEQRFSFSRQQLINLLDMLLVARNKIAFSPIEQLPLELVVAQFCAPTEQKKTKEPSKEEQETKPKVEEQKEVAKDEPVVKLNGNVTFDKDTWAKVVLAAKQSNATVDALLRAVTPIEMKDNELKLGVFYRFHKERLETNQHKRELEDIVSKVLGGQVKISCVLAERENAAPQVKNTISAQEANVTVARSNGGDILKAAEEVFGI